MAKATTNTIPAPAAPTSAYTEEEYKEAKQVTLAYEQAEADRVQALRDAYKVPVSALVAMDEFKTVYSKLVDINASNDADGSLSMNVESLAIVMRGMASMVGVNMDATPEATAPA